MPTIELFKDGDRVIVDIGSEPETVWRAKGFSEVKDAAKSVIAEDVVKEPITNKPGRPAKKTEQYCLFVDED